MWICASSLPLVCLTAAPLLLDVQGRRPETLLERVIAGEATLPEVTGCPRRAAFDLTPLLNQIASDVKPQDEATCSRAAEQLYCEAVLDVFQPWPFQRTCPDPHAASTSMQLQAEGSIRIAFLIFMVDEVEAVQQLLRYRSTEDSALVHVDLRHPKAHSKMKDWAAKEHGVLVKSRWAVMRTGFSAGRSLLDLLEIALSELKPWDVVLFLSASHFPLRPRAELARFLWYHPLNFAGSEEGTLRLEDFPPLTHHLQIGFECSRRLWDMMRDDNHNTVTLSQLGHPNVTVAHGQPFVILRRNFVEWVSSTRRSRGSPVWVLLRHLLRVWCNVEKLFQTLLFNTEWCVHSNFRHDLTFAHMEIDKQQTHHKSGLSGDGTQGRAIKSATMLSPADLKELQTARVNHWARSGFEGVPGDAPKSPDGRPDPHVSPAFVAFARKVDPDLRQLLAASAAFEQPSLSEPPRPWPLAAHVWKLLAPNLPSSGFRELRRPCGSMNGRTPCAAELQLSASRRVATSEDKSVPSVLLRERVGVAIGRVYALQIGAGWDAASAELTMPSILPSGEAVHVQFFTVIRHAAELDGPLMARALFLAPRTGAMHVVPPAFDLRTAAPGGSVRFGSQDLLESGEWIFVLEALQELDVYAPFKGFAGSSTVLAHRPFYVYSDLAEVTIEVVEKYFEWSTSENGTQTTQ